MYTRCCAKRRLSSHVDRDSTQNSIILEFLAVIMQRGADLTAVARQATAISRLGNGEMELWLEAQNVYDVFKMRLRSTVTLCSLAPATKFPLMQASTTFAGALTCCLRDQMAGYRPEYYPDLDFNQGYSLQFSRQSIKNVDEKTTAWQGTCLENRSLIYRRHC